MGGTRGGPPPPPTSTFGRGGGGGGGGQSGGNNRLLPLPEHYSALFHPLATEPQNSCALEIWLQLALVNTNNPHSMHGLINLWISPVQLTKAQILYQRRMRKMKMATKQLISTREEYPEDDKSLIDITGEAGRLLDDEEHELVREVKFTSHSFDYSRFMKHLSNLHGISLMKNSIWMAKVPPFHPL